MTPDPAIIRVFPRRTRATPNDPNVVVGKGPGLIVPGKVEVSVTFTWDLPFAERLAKLWSDIAPTEIGGPAMGAPGGDFEPGRFLKRGYVITSRGCPNRCWFCSVWKREGSTVRELPIRDGWNVQDDNLLACSESHIRAVFAMLKRQDQPAEFTGGFEAKRLGDWHIELLVDLKPRQIFFAYDTPDDYEPLVSAGKKLVQAFPHSGHMLRAYVLIGYSGDTCEKAEGRLKDTYAAGFFPMAMLWRNENGDREESWKSFQRCWARPVIIDRMCRGFSQPSKALVSSLWK